MKRFVTLILIMMGFVATFMVMRTFFPAIGWIADWAAVIAWSLAYVAINKGTFSARIFHFLAAAAACAVSALLMATNWFDSGL